VIVVSRRVPSTVPNWRSVVVVPSRPPQPRPDADLRGGAARRHRGLAPGEHSWCATRSLRSSRGKLTVWSVALRQPIAGCRRWPAASRWVCASGSGVVRNSMTLRAGARQLSAAMYPSTGALAAKSHYQLPEMPAALAVTACTFINYLWDSLAARACAR